MLGLGVSLLKSSSDGVRVIEAGIISGPSLANLIVGFLFIASLAGEGPSDDSTSLLISIIAVLYGANLLTYGVFLFMSAFWNDFF